MSWLKCHSGLNSGRYSNILTRSAHSALLSRLAFLTIRKRRLYTNDACPLADRPASLLRLFWALLGRPRRRRRPALPLLALARRSRRTAARTLALTSISTWKTHNWCLAVGQTKASALGYRLEPSVTTTLGSKP